MTDTTRWTLVGAPAQAYLEPAEAEPATLLPRRPEALRVLATESDSWVRLGVGLAAWLLGVAGGAALAASLWSETPVWARVAALVAAAVLLLTAVRLGRKVWQAGRQVVDAYCWWTLLPERLAGGGAGVDDWRASPFTDAVEARVFVYRGWRVLRIVLATLSVFAPLVFLISLEDSPRFQPTWHHGEAPAVTAFALVLAAVGLTAGSILMWGQYRAARAHAERDPIQRWILRRDR